MSTVDADDLVNVFKNESQNYARFTDSKGNLLINIKVSFNINGVLFADDLKMHYNDGSKFKATLLNGQGNFYSNQRIEFNVNGVIYARTTDSSGEAKMDIHLMPGEYIMTSSYNRYSTSNKITVS